MVPTVPNMMFDNSPKAPPPTSRNVGEHLAMAVLIGGAFAAAIGMHFASLTIVALGVGHLLLGGLAIVIRGARSKHSSGEPT